MAKKNVEQLYVERRVQGDYAVRRLGSERASAVESTQRQAIERRSRLSRIRRRWLSESAIPTSDIRTSGAPPDGARFVIA